MAVDIYEETYFYNGEYMTISQLMEHSQGISENQVRARLRNGWNVEAALAPILDENFLDPKWDGKDLIVIFRKHIPDVFSRMQPVLNKPYKAQCNIPYHKASSKQFFVITLESGRKLIVYPRDFEILGEATASA